tara:strand:+ start:645 stop:1019 length:375 start_codon:yes stop_codon:yes gene_type:complete
MSKLCQGPLCHTYDTTDRKRGPKGNKRNQTRTVGKYGYGNGSFCTTGCQNDWWAEHGTRAVDNAGRIHQPIILTEQNSWIKQENYYTWQRENGEPRYYYRNMLTREQRPLTEQQYNDNNYTLNT